MMLGRGDLRCRCLHLVYLAFPAEEIGELRHSPGGLPRTVSLAANASSGTMEVLAIFSTEVSMQLFTPWWLVLYTSQLHCRLLGLDGNSSGDCGSTPTDRRPSQSSRGGSCVTGTDPA